MQNLALAYGQSVDWTIKNHQYAGYNMGIQAFSDALDSAPGLTACDRLFSVLAALQVGSRTAVSFTQWRAAVQSGGVVQLRPGAVRIAGTDFF
jgi:hypothetical protein